MIIDVDIVLIARDHVLKFYNLDGAEAIHKLLKIIESDLGVAGYKDPNNIGFEFDEEPARKLVQLAGPHWYTLLKAYEAKKCPA